MANQRVCIMCGKSYEYCPNNCRGKVFSEPWGVLFHDENCLAISKVWYAYRGKEISKAEAKRQMGEIPNIDDVLKNESIAANEIKEIFQEEKPVEIQQDDVVVQQPETEKSITGKRSNKRKSREVE